ncbi:MAG TPA: hypothetical protein VFN64_06940 [Burkholderiaceae bacterium]|nr:hypothetical protein [Burkholderiaceae bacterium]
MNRRTFLTASAALMSAACGGSGESDAAPGATSPTTSTPPAPPPTTPAPPPTPGTPTSVTSTSARLTTLTLYAAQSGALPYTAAVYPLEGSVPSGSYIASPDDPSLASSVLSRWPDGSAAVVVVAGEASLASGTAKTIVLATTTSNATALTPARVAALVKNVTVNAGTLGVASVSNFASPERTWWANARVICCRYRAAIDSTLEAVIDIHAFASDRAFVEVVVENARIDANAAIPARPATKTYAGVTVTVNGQEVATVASPGSGQSYASGSGGGRYEGGHEAFRAWHCSTWIGGDPKVEVTHDIASLQAHPLFFRCWKDANDDYRSRYQDDAYVAWSAGRLNVPGMPSGGDADGIGPLTQWDAHYLQTGSRYARRAVVASALGALSCNVNTRDRTSGRVPTHAQTNGKTQDDGSWPKTTSEPAWEVAHHPAVGLMAFLCQPSPVFIEIAQKIAIWNGTALQKDGVFGFWAQVRGKAWGIRSLAHAIFLTPDGDDWKTAARASLAANVRVIDTFRRSPNATLGFVWHAAPERCADFEARIEGMQQPLWMHHWLILSLHAAERAKVLTGADQALLATAADWAALQPVRYVNEAQNGEWRLHNYLTMVGRAAVSSADDNLGSGIYAGTTFDALPTYAQNFAWFYRDAPPPSSGKFLFIETDPGRNPNYRAWSSAVGTDTAGVSYAAIFWAALTAAVERNVSGADAAWTKVTNGISNLPTWAGSFAAEPRYNRYPRNR